MTTQALLEAAIEYSDNTAANLLLTAIGGPAGLTKYVRGLGDAVTRLDRTEPTLNTNIKGDPRDTTTPAAMLADLQTVLVGATALSDPSRRHLIDWLVANTTGNERLRAGLPAGWRVGDKTGTGVNGATNDIAIAWPPGKPPVLIAAYFSESRAPDADRSRALADVARIGADAFTA
jgi:beta-lactamase class A